MINDIAAEIKEIKNKYEQAPSILVKQRILLKKTTFKCHFFKGYCITEYNNPKVAEEVYKKMNTTGLSVKKEDNKIIEYRKGLTEWEIFELYLADILNAKKSIKNKVSSSIKYEFFERR